MIGPVYSRGEGAELVLGLRAESKHCNLRGAVHGGILATLADVACAAAIGPFDYSTEIPVSTELHVRYFGQPQTSPLVAEAQIVHRGKRLIAAECVIRDADGRQVARASGTYVIVPRA